MSNPLISKTATLGPSGLARAFAAVTVDESDGSVEFHACTAERLTYKDLKGIIRARKRKESRLSKAVGSGEELPPRTLKEAFEHPERGEAWKKSALDEFQGLTDMGVLDHDYSWEELRDKLKIDVEGSSPPISMSIALSHKYDQQGVLDRLKTRMAIAGHPGNMQKGVHYDKTFAATPNQHSSRIMQAMRVRHKWKAKCFDIKQAYCWAELSNDQLIALKYPPGFERYDADGNPLYMVCRKNLYGHPGAARAWSKTRDEFIMNNFNDNGWTCFKCIMDPSMFYITYSDPKNDSDVNSSEAIVMIHTDDVDMIGSDDHILKMIADACHDKWEIKVVDEGFMLGVKRTLTNNDDEFSVELTMTAYVDGMVKAFEEYDKPKHVKTPFPEHEAGHISRLDPTPPEEVKEVLNRGYMRLVGMLLWASRNVFPECAYGTSVMCSVMSCPSEKAWKAGMHMLVWLRQSRLRGIKFTHDVPNDEPFALSDSNFMHGIKHRGELKKHDFKDQYGWVIMWQGGPVAWSSRKHNHVGKSTCQVEYMALYHCENTKWPL